MQSQLMDFKQGPSAPQLDDLDFEDEADHFCCDLTGFLSPAEAVIDNQFGLQGVERSGNLNDPSPPASSLSVHQGPNAQHLQHPHPHPSNGSGGGANDFRSPFALPVPHGGSAEHAYYFSSLTPGQHQPAPSLPFRNQALLGFLNQQQLSQGQVRPATTGSLHLGAALAFQPYQHRAGPLSGPLPASPPQVEFQQRRRAVSSSGANHHHTATSEPCAVPHHTPVTPQTQVKSAPSVGSDHQPSISMMYSAAGPSSSNGHGPSGQVAEALDTLHRIGITTGAPHSRTDALPDVNRLLSEIPEELIPQVVEKAHRRGKGGRQPAIDPRMDPSIDPKKARRILANRQSAARSKMKQKLLVETLRTRQDVLASQRATSREELDLLRRMCADLQAKNAELEQRLSELVTSQAAMQQHGQDAAPSHLPRAQQQQQGGVMGMGLNLGGGSGGDSSSHHWAIHGHSGMAQQLRPSLLQVQPLGQVLHAQQQQAAGMEGVEGLTGYVM